MRKTSSVFGFGATFSVEAQFTELAPRLYRFLLRLCGNPDLASDLAQEALTRGWQRRAQLREPAALQTWLFRIALRTWTDARERSNAKRVNYIDCEVADSAPQPIDVSIGKEMGAMLWQRMGTLPERQQQVLHLRVVEQMEIQEIAEVFGISSQNVRSNLAAARKTLRASFETHANCVSRSHSS